MLSVALFKEFVECHYANGRCAECPYAVCRYAEFHGALAQREKFYQWADSCLELSLSFKIATSQFWTQDFF